ncbi:MAG: zinc metallopeptidase [Lentisphaeria bacterium]|nr:zinc metallopeptidase [Lentisphaeria bacterium]
MLGIGIDYYIFVLIPSLIIGGLASWMTKRAFNKYSEIGTRRGLTGAEAARLMLQREGVEGVAIEEVGGFLSDHYNPMSRSLHLSSKNFHGRSIAAVGIACHEAGHAIQHSRNYAPMWARSVLVPVTNICTNLYFIPILIGVIAQIPGLAYLGLGMCAVGLVFALVTLPVEWDASRRAKIAIRQAGFLTTQEQSGASKVLNAAFLTYVAAMVSALITVIYYAIRLGLLGGSDD